ncbi:MAG: UDP-3-O-(3-hydroxymyristoyl)glucosamine N-acyltransferase [Legionellales bacterium RIFCSPHIGHO2_12_FULL_35_11]|nr:MAG: UDP-3-O-(3-hydroxymyristoyl)glucosamine N-acyltransferase [Legionellales bacterium RIFCSPHIGHO2_12_FULL_35_11]
MNVTLTKIAELTKGIVIGDKNIMINSLSPINDVTEGSLIFAEGADNLKKAESSAAAAVLVANNVTSSSKPIIRVSNPFKSFTDLLTHFYPEIKQKCGIHPTAVIEEGVTFGERVSIGAYVVIQTNSKIGNDAIIKSHVHIGHNVNIGDRSVIHPNVCIYDNSYLGNDVTIHAGAVIGSDGFGYTFDNGEHIKVPHVGSVMIHDKVEIGANSIVDRATIGKTVIGEGSKIDNLVQIAHSVKLGKQNILCAFTGIAGSTTTGDNVLFAANVGVSDHVQIDDGVILGARAGVPPKKHLKQGNIYLGSPARPKDKAIEQELATTRIPFMRKNIQCLTEKVARLTEKVNHLETEGK